MWDFKEVIWVLPEAHLCSFVPSVVNAEIIPAPSSLHFSRVPVPVRSTSPCGVGASRRFSIIPAGFGCEVGIDAWVGGYVPVVGVAIQLTLPPQPFRAAWWQPTLLIHVAWVRRVRNEKQGAD